MVAASRCCGGELLVGGGGSLLAEAYCWPCGWWLRAGQRESVGEPPYNLHQTSLNSCRSEQVFERVRAKLMAQLMEEHVVHPTPNLYHALGDAWNDISSSLG